MPSSVLTTVIPCGGAIRIDVPDYALASASGISSMMLERSVSGISTWTTLYSGSPVPVYVDAGDSLPSPLIGSNTYLYRITDSRSQIVTSGVTPISSITSTPDGFTELLIRLLQGALNNITLPTGIGAVQVTSQMPQGGLQVLSLIVVNLELIQQLFTSIGRNVTNPDSNNTWTIPNLVERTWRISVMSKNAMERDFYRDTLLVILQILVSTVFNKIGQDVTNRFQAASGTDAKEYEGKAPGMYYADILFEISGSFDATITTSYGNVGTLTTAITSKITDIVNVHS